MPAPLHISKRTVVTFRDARGFTAQTTYHVDVQALGNRFTHASNIYTPLIALSNAFDQGSRGLHNRELTGIDYGDVADYQSVFDKADMVFSTDGGELLHYRIPAPKIAMFLADRETIDAGNGLVSTWAAAMLANFACTRNGAALIRFLGGRLVRQTKPRRLTTITLNPSLTGPGW